MDEKGNVLATGQTDRRRGRYRLRVGEEERYLVHFTSAVEHSGGILAPAHIPRTETLQGGRDTLRADAVMQPGGALLLCAPDRNGRALSRLELEERQLMTTDLQGLPALSVLSECSQGEDREVPAIIIPVEAGVGIALVWEIEGFGAVLLTADNEGQGYVVIRPGDLSALDLNEELLKSQIHRLDWNLRAATRHGLSVPAEAERRLGEGRALYRASSGETDPAVRGRLLDRATGEALLGLEGLEIDLARQNIERYRKSPVRLRVVDREGKGLPGLEVAARQVSHDFAFGVIIMPDYERIIHDLERGRPGEFYDFDRRTYELLKDAGVNTASVMVSQGFSEPDSTLQYYANYYGLEELNRMGYRLVGRELIYHAEADFTFPPYLRDLTFPELVENQRQHVTRVVRRYQHIIKHWGVTAEANWYIALPWATLNLSLDQTIEITRVGIQAIREIDPGAEIRINVSDPATRDYYPALDPSLCQAYGEGFIHPYAYLERLETANLDYDVLSLQLYTGAHVGNGYFCPALDLATISAWLDRFAAFGRKIQLDTGVNHSWDPEWPRTYWHRPWDEETQAEFLRAFYTIAFGKPYVCEIAWFGIRDTVNLFQYAILNPDHTPKPAYLALKDVIRSWTTTATGETDLHGEFRFAGFAGTYELAVRGGGAATTTSIHIAEGMENRVEVAMA
jgi:hypothetical protein